MSPSGGFLKKIHYLAVEGGIGAGKTSFCRILGQKLNARLVLEEPEENPFMKDFYSDPKANAFKVQLWFLLSRFDQVSELHQKDLFHNTIISDYIFEKDRVFAELNLDDRELTVYDKVAGALERELPKPDCIIYLQSSTQRLLKNIRKRDRSYEGDISPEYVDRLNEAYNQFFFNYTGAPVLIVDASEIDFVKNAEDLQEILNELDKEVKGTRFFKPPRKGV